MDGCPSDERWRLFLHSALDDEENAALDAHLAQCPSCQGRLDALYDGDAARKWRRLLTDGGTAVVPGRDAEILQRIKEHPSPVLAGTGSTTSSTQIIFPDASEPDAPLGRLGHFRIVEELGSGATGVVFRAYDTELNRTVAIKVLRPELAVSRDALDLFRREARSAGAIQHPSVVAIHDVSRSDDFPLPYIVMEFVDGEPLATSHRRAHRHAVPEAVRIVGQVASGLAQAHERGLIHRDVKPANILIDRHTQQAKLTDFGIARTAVPQGDGTAQPGTTTRYAVGTPPYMSPEQLRGQPVDIRTDVYGLGATLYELLTGQPPFPADSSPETIRLVCEDDPVSPRRLRPEIPRVLEVICLKALSKNRSQRYATAGDFADDLDRFTSGRPIQARSSSVPERLFSWGRRNRAMAVLLAALAILLTTGPLVISALWLNAERIRVSAAADRRDAERSAQQRDTLSLVVNLRQAAQAYHDHRDSDVVAALPFVPVSQRGWEFDWLDAALARRPRPIEIVDINEWGINAILVSPDGRHAVTSGQDGRVARYTLADGQTKELAGREWSEELGRFRHFLPDVSVTQLFRKLRPDTAQRELAARYPDCFVSLCWVVPGVSVAGASYRGRGVVWDLESGAERVILTHDRPLLSAAASPDGHRLLFGDDKGVMIRLDRTKGEKTQAVLEGGAVSAIATLPRGGWVVGQEDGNVRFVSAEGRPEPAWRRLVGAVWGLDVAPDGRRMAVACGQPEVLLVELDGGGSPRPVSLEHLQLPSSDGGKPRAAHAVRFAPDGQHLAVGDDLGRFLLWEVHSGNLVVARKGLSDRSRIRERDDKLVGLLPLPLRRRYTAIAFLPDGRSCLTGSDDTALRRWTLETADGPRMFPTAPGALIEFDRTDPCVLWVAANDGRLRLFDADTGKALGTGSGPAHDGPATGLSVAAKSGLAATCGDDGTVRFWRRDKTELCVAATTLQHPRPLRSVGLSPQGDRVVAYDVDDSLVLWDVGSGRVLGRQSLRATGTGPAVSGLVGFNRDGTQVAVLGPIQTCWRYSGRDLTLVKRAAVVAGSGGTALNWSPIEPGELVTGDTDRRIAFDPPRPVNFVHPWLDASVAGVAFSADGMKVFSVTSSGRLSVFDTRGAEIVLTLNDAHPDPTSLRVDPTGARVAVAHADGSVAVWATEKRLRAAAAASGRAAGWTESVLQEKTNARDIRTRDQTVALDGRGRTWVLSIRKSDRPGEDDHYFVCLGHERTRGGPLEEEVLHDAGVLTERQRDGYASSLALAVSADTAFAVETRWGNENNGQIFLYRRPLEAGGGPKTPAEPLTTEANWGSFPSLLLGTDGQPFVLHFSFNGFYLYRSPGRANRLDPDRVGRLGDGYYHQAVVFPDGDVGITFGTRRFNSDPSQMTYLRLGATQLREVPSGGWVALSLTLRPAGRPLILARRGGATKAGEHGVLERTAQGRWVETTRVPCTIDGAQGLVCDRKGTLYTCSVDERSNGAILLKYDGASWTATTVWSDPALSRKDGEELKCLVRLDHKDQPVMVLILRSDTQGRLCVLRPAEGR